MGKTKSESHSRGDVKMEVDEDVKPSVHELAGNGTMETPKSTKIGQDEYDELCAMVNAIAHPLASRKLAKRIYKLIKKASKEKQHLRQGLCDVQKALRKNETGVIILAGNVSPIDVYSHIPALCEEKDIPYIFTPSREHLGLAAGHKRAAVLLLIKEHAEYADLFQEVREMIKTTSPEA